MKEQINKIKAVLLELWHDYYETEAAMSMAQEAGNSDGMKLCQRNMDRIIAQIVGINKVVDILGIKL